MVETHILILSLDVMTDPNQTLQQYTRGFGHPRLIEALSRLYTRLLNRPNLNAQTELLVTVSNSMFQSFGVIVQRVR